MKRTQKLNIVGSFSTGSSFIARNSQRSYWLIASLKTNISTVGFNKAMRHSNPPQS